MPPSTPKQARFIRAEANRGEKWAQDYIAEAPTMKPKRRKKKRKRKRKKQKHR
jgi:hypothetical protein